MSYAGGYENDTDRELAQSAGSFARSEVKRGIKQRAKKRAAEKAAAKEGAKAAASAGSKLAVAAKPLLVAVGGVLLWVICLFSLGCIIGLILNTLDLQSVDDIRGAVVAGAAREWHSVYDDGPYEEPVRTAFNEGQDPDTTALFWQRMVEMRNRIDSGYYSSDDGNSSYGGGSTTFTPLAQAYIAANHPITPFESEAEEMAWFDMMREEHLMISPEDMLELVEKCYEKNENMFQMEYFYYEWRNLASGTVETAQTSEGDLDTEGLNDNIYLNLSRTKIEGELERGSDTVRRFAMHWPEVITLATRMGNEAYDAWDNEGERSEYDPNSNEEGVYATNETNEYYMTDADIERVFNLFKYDFAYYYDAVADGKSHNSRATRWKIDQLEDGLASTPSASGQMGIAYRYKFTPGDLRRFVPESAPLSIHNSWETLNYIYTSTNNVPGYTPEGESFQPMEGLYCVGRWQVIDPLPFIEGMRDITPHYYDKFINERAGGSGYDWVHEMVQHFVEHMEVIGISQTYNRSDLFWDLAALYGEKKIRVVYEGTRCAEQEEYLEYLIAKIAAERPDWTVEVVEAEAGLVSDEYWEVPDDLSGIPFSSYGVTYIQSPYVTANGILLGSYSLPNVSLLTSGTLWLNGFGWYNVLAAANYNLATPVYYTREQIEVMLQNLQNRQTSSRWPPLDMMSAVDAVYNYNQQNGTDVAALFAIIITEGTMNSRHGREHYNFFDYTVTAGETRYDGDHPWWDARTDSGGDLGAALVAGMRKIERNYWHREETGRGPSQATFFQMQFGAEYGQPQSEAEAPEGFGGHSYCPPTPGENAALFSTGNSMNSWSNSTATYYARLRELAGNPLDVSGIVGEDGEGAESGSEGE